MTSRFVKAAILLSLVGTFAASDGLHAAAELVERLEPIHHVGVGS